VSDNPAAHGQRLVRLVMLWVALILIETLNQIALKTAGNHIGAFELNRHSVLAAVSTPWLWVGLACYVTEFCLWMMILEKSALSAAFPLSAIAFITVMIASWAVFGDSMGWQQIVGAAIIVLGIILLGGTAQPTGALGHPHGSQTNGR
jgi:drug/metabolite transporter (DMT)-like permease